MTVCITRLIQNGHIYILLFRRMFAFCLKSNRPILKMSANFDEISDFFTLYCTHQFTWSKAFLVSDSWIISHDLMVRNLIAIKLRTYRGVGKNRKIRTEKVFRFFPMFSGSFPWFPDFSNIGFSLRFYRMNKKSTVYGCECRFTNDTCELTAHDRLLICLLEVICDIKQIQDGQKSFKI